ncbi:MAG: hypothetical protein ACQEQG_06475 [Bacillota bacterium]
MKRVILFILIAVLLLFPAHVKANLLTPVSPDLEISHNIEEAYLFWNGETQLSGGQSQVEYSGQGYVLSVIPLTGPSKTADLAEDLGNRFRRQLLERPRGFELPEPLYLMIDLDNIVNPSASSQVTLTAGEESAARTDQLEDHVMKFLTDQVDESELIDITLPANLLNRPGSESLSGFLLQLYHLPESETEAEQTVWLRSQDWETEQDQMFYPLADTQAERFQGFAVMADDEPVWLTYGPADFSRYVPISLTTPVHLAALDTDLIGFYPTIVIYSQYLQFERPADGFAQDLKIYGDPVHLIR